MQRGKRQREGGDHLPVSGGDKEISDVIDHPKLVAGWRLEVKLKQNGLNGEGLKIDNV